jgi:diguanylate cyclase (GGDEF)-like protein
MDETLTRVDDRNARAWDLMLSDPEEALSLAESALSDAVAAGYARGAAEAYLNVGWCANYLTRTEAAIDSLQKALDGFESLGDALGIMKALNALGVVYHEIARYERAMDYYTRSLEAARRGGNPSREAATLSNIGEICLEIGEHKEALDYFLKAYETVPDEDEPEIMANILLNIGTTFLRLENWPLAREFTEKAMVIAHASDDLQVEGQCWQALGRISRASEKLDLAEHQFAKAIAVYESLKNEKNRAAALLDLGSINVDRGEIDVALGRFQAALETAEGIDAKALIHSAYERLSEAFEKKGDYRLALEYYRRFARYEHEALNEDASRKIKNITIQYEVEKSRQEAEIYRLKNIELKEKGEALEEANRQITDIAEAGRKITASLDMDTVIQTLYETLSQHVPFDLFGLALYDEIEHSLDYRAYIERGQRRHRLRLSLDPKRSFAALCARDNKAFFLDDVETQAGQYLENRTQSYGTSAGSLIFHPLAIDERVIGVLTVQSKDKGALAQRHMTFIGALAPYAAIAVDNSLTHDRLEELNRAVTGEKEALERATERITHIANHDPLTGLPNRRLLFELLQKTFDIARRNGTKVGVIYIDLDDFKPINDEMGHIAGDRALVAVAERLGSLLRASDTVARVGGDEFVSVLANARDRQDIEAASRKILDECRKPFVVDGRDCHLGISMGIAVFPDNGSSIEQIIGAADTAMYMVKRERKNGLAFAS